MLRNRYNILLGIVVVHLFVLTLALPRPWNDLVNIGVAPVAALMVRFITGRPRDAWAMLILASSASLLNLVLPWGAVPLSVDLLKVGLWCLAPAYLAQRVFVTIYDAEAITHAEISGAVAVYLLLALVFANVFEALHVLDPGAIQFGANFPEQSGFREILYFSFVTLSTLGYGDVAPASALARDIAVVEAVTGLMYMAILVARFVSLHSADRLERRRKQAREHG
jgi:voltage-gated potassium channel Kch